MSLQDDRRNTGGQRIPFEALVVVADGKSSGSAYECEAVDVSEHGMHLRTAYLPELGQALTFRFDGGSGEVVADGTVLWRDEQAKGGEFGVRFTHLDDGSIAALRDICGIVEGQDEAAAGEPSEAGAAPKAQRGARVRLHIEGLGSPMRARVRDAQTGEVMVGSNLEFLKVGRTLDLEDVEGGKKRAAIIDRVEVEVDPESRIPQLVVTLRYEGVAAKEVAIPLVSKKDAKAKERGASADAGADADAADGSHDDDADDGESDRKQSPLSAFADKAKGLAAQVGPRLMAFGATTSSAFQGVVAKVKARRAESSEDGDADEDRPRRVTSPAPEGGLRASGRKVVRGERDDEMNDDVELEETDEARAKQRRRAKIFAISAAGFLATMLVVLGLRARSAPPGEGTAATGSAEAPAVAALPPHPAMPPAGSAEAVSANVPLFGTTPLSTTEPAAAPPPDPKATAAAPAAPAADDGDDKAEPGTTTFGKGKVAHAKVVRLKLDAPITDIKGSVDKNTITISVPGRRNVESAGTLAKKDKRLASVKAVPKDGGIDVVYTFKDTPPPFLAKVDGKLLVMELGEKAKADADDGEQHAKKGKKKNKAVAKKGDKKSKKKHKTDD